MLGEDDERTGMITGKPSSTPVLVGRAPRWFYAGVLVLGALGVLTLLVSTGNSGAAFTFGGFAATPPPPPPPPSVVAPLTVEVAESSESAAPVDEPDFREMFTKREHMIPMRDGVKLYVAVYTPKAQGFAAAPPAPMPMLMSRTPYSCAPYGEDQFPTGQSRGDMQHYFNEGWIFVRADVRGRYASEGLFVQMTPHIDDKMSDTDIDEASDTYDTIEWLINNVPNNNGRVGIMGISYPGFYSAAGMIDNHPALKAASPQAPITDWFIGDDFHHNGALWLPHAFRFLTNFGKENENPTRTGFQPFGAFDYRTPDGYEFYLNMGPVRNAAAMMESNGPMKDGSTSTEGQGGGGANIWPDLMAHPNYDEFWQSRNLRDHFNNIDCAVLSVGGWYDAEDPLGPFAVYYGTTANNPDNDQVTIVAGPWAHGQWSSGTGITALGDVEFFSRTEEYYREYIEKPFFRKHLKTPGTGEEIPDFPKHCNSSSQCRNVLWLGPQAIVFEVGANQWRRFNEWPPAAATPRSIHFRAGGGLSLFEPAASPDIAFDEYISDPARPVPYIDKIAIGMTRPYMTDDQRFASRRPDVLVYQTNVLEDDLSIVGPLTATLRVSTTGTDSDFVVKLIDVYSGDHPGVGPESGVVMGGYQQLVRGEPMRGKFRNSFETPEPFVPDEITTVQFTMPDIFHTFRKGHRLMVHVQSSWFPLIDRNPQTFTNINTCGEDAFVSATQRVYEGSTLDVMVL